jgi:hypothetical protein
LGKIVKVVVGIGVLLILFTIVSMLVGIYGQDVQQTCLMTHAVIHNDAHLVIIDLTAEGNIDCIAYYASQGYEIKATLGTMKNLEIFMQK